MLPLCLSKPGHKKFLLPFLFSTTFFYHLYVCYLQHFFFYMQTLKIEMLVYYSIVLSSGASLCQNLQLSGEISQTDSSRFSSKRQKKQLVV